MISAYDRTMKALQVVFHLFRVEFHAFPLIQNFTKADLSHPVLILNARLPLSP